MAVFEYWRDITPGSPNDTVNRYQYDTDDDSIAFDSFATASGTLGPIHPPVGTVMYQQCVGLDRVFYKSTGGPGAINKETTVNSPSCCQVEAVDFSVVRTNNTSLITPNGTITITSTTEDVNDYEASIDGGANWTGALDDAITFEDLPAGNYDIIIRLISGVCAVNTSVTISDNISYPPLIIHEETQPNLYSPIFHPITLGFLLTNNLATVKSDVNGTYLEVDSEDAKDYLATLPIIRLLGNVDYIGTYQVTEVDDVDDPTKFYFNGTYLVEGGVYFVPFDRQVFQLFCESAFNNYVKIADITVYPDDEGEYLLRLDGFLQSAFRVMQPINEGDEITLLRKYYVSPLAFDVETTPTIFNAVYSAVPDLTNFLTDLAPLGPVPINFISELTQKGLPVLFSYIDTATGRIKNITSSAQNNIVSIDPLVLVFGLPLNQYDVQWINPAGVIADLQVDPALPDWITMLQNPSDTVNLHINAFEETSGDYDEDDYDEEDYMTHGVNAIVGCYEFEFSDGVTPLFTLRICIFPTQSVNPACAGDSTFNIAWINREGGWSSYIFEGRKTYGIDIGKETTYKKGRQLKRSSVEEVYQTAEVLISNKAIADLKFIASLRQSIQAYLYDNNTLQWSIPIKLDKENFNVYSTPFRQIEVEEKFTFRYAEEIVIQTQ